MKKAAGLILLLALVSGCDPSRPPPAKIFHLTQRAKLAHDTGTSRGYVEAAKLLHEAIEARGNDPSLWIHMARVLVATKDPSAAGTLEAIRGHFRSPDVPVEVLYLEALVARRRDDVEVAIERYWMVTARDPDCLTAWYQLGALLQGSGDVAGAVAALSEVTKRDRGHLGVGALYRIAAIQRETGRTVESAAALAQLETLREALGERQPGPDIFERCRYTSMTLAPCTRADVEPPALDVRFREVTEYGIDVRGVRDILTVDFDSDGDRDVVLLCDDGLRFVRNEVVSPWTSGTSMSSRLTDITAQSGPLPDRTVTAGARLLAGDHDGDGFVDVAVAGGERGLLLVHGRDGARFEVAAETVLGAGSGIVDGQFLDFDVDGHLDLVLLTSVGDAGAARYDVVILRGNGGGRTCLYTDVRAAAVSGDFDADGIADLVVAASTGVVLLRCPGGPNASTERIPGLEGHEVLLAGDLDNDGDMDIVALPASGVPLRVAWNEVGMGPFSGPLAPRFRVEDVEGESPSPVVDGSLLDIDNDGDLDVAAVGPAGVECWINTRGGVLSRRVITGSARMRVTRTSWIDADGDGLLDLLVIDGGRGKGLRLFRNESTPVHAVYRLRLVGARYDTHGIGARVEFYAGRIFQSLWLAEPVEARFGVGPLATQDDDERLQIDGFRIIWPGGSTQSIGPRELRWDAHRRMVVVRTRRSAADFPDPENPEPDEAK